MTGLSRVFSGPASPQTSSHVQDLCQKLTIAARREASAPPIPVIPIPVSSGVNELVIADRYSGWLSVLYVGKGEFDTVCNRQLTYYLLTRRI